ncbi:MAG: hypothetical protein ACON3Z_13955 [Bradymonadia bacterium]
MASCSVCQFEVDDVVYYCPQCGVRIDESARDTIVATSLGMPQPTPHVADREVDTSTAEIQDAEKSSPLEAVDMPTILSSSRGVHLALQNAHDTLLELPAVSDVSRVSSMDDVDEIDTAAALLVETSPRHADETVDVAPEEEDGPAEQMRSASVESLKPTAVFTAIDDKMGSSSAEYPHDSGHSGGTLFLALGAILLALGGGMLWWAWPIETTRLQFKAATTHQSDGLLHVSVPVTSNRHLAMTYPGGQTTVSGSSKIEFGYAIDALKLGANPVDLKARSDDAELSIDHEFFIHYRLRPINMNSAGLELQVDAAPGARVSVERGELSELAKDSYRWKVEPNSVEKQSGTIALSLTVAPRRGPTKRYEEHFELATQSVPVILLSPVPGLLGDGKTVLVNGFAVPGASVEVGGQTATANRDGYFQVVHTPDVDDDHLVVRVSALGYENTGIKAAFTLASKSERLRELGRLRRAKAKLAAEKLNIDKAGKAFRLTDSADKIIEFNGRLIARWRTGPALKAMLVDPCSENTSCPVWVDYAGLDVARIGQRVAVVGRRVGDKKYEANDGQTRTVGRILAEVVVP